MRLIRSGISLYAAHTSYDRVTGGIGDILASRLGLSQIEAVPDSGEDLMRTGYLKSPLKKDEFIDYVKRALCAGMLRVSVTEIETVSKVALVGGSGGGFTEAAKRSGADALVTGEAKHHHFINAKIQNVLLVEAGHYETERSFTQQVFMSLQSTLNELQLNVELFEANSAQAPYECI
jgi:dinuclear metal center YbgI/SA1388 family protein